VPATVAAMSRLVRTATAGLVFSLCLLFLAVTPARAQSELDQARTNASAAAAAADEASEAAEAARQRARVALNELEHAIGSLEEVEARATVVEAGAEAARLELVDLRVAVHDLTVRRYVATDDNSVAAIAQASGSTGFSDVHAQIRASTLFRFAVLDGGNDVDRFRFVESEYARILAELADLAVRQSEAVVQLDEGNAVVAAELQEMEAQLDLAEAKEAEFRREAARLEKEERIRLEAERQARLAEQRRQAEEAARRAAAEEAARTNSPVIRGDSGFLCPVGGSTSFGDTWGAPRSGGRSHRGVDMFAAKGTPVVASVGGVVRHRDNSLGGKAYYLDGDDGNRYYGAHLDTYGASGRVTAGTVIGTVGNTGNARFTSPHLHFEIHLNGGSAVNPTPTVLAACG
jgi:murein DD-endopeptidase MepM/ murein hydrolase activator NlpD